ncbi:uncharacterized protein LOC123531268 [Mercenaria mercenaria]|uniref:uncharacterized protein LOC123531268 n=1 Tax=Mercenaria mercenaria TaxID=6596 RepID=UPI00234EFC79|nr:uncharacterized protein LOC123531268 [Mercenaria mercenaria]
MCFRIVFYCCFIYCLFLFRFGGADESLVTSKRADTDASSDSSRSFQDMLSDFLSNLFGSSPNETEVADTAMNDKNNSSDTGQAFLTNATQSGITMAENNTETNFEALQQEVASLNSSTNAATNTTSLPELNTSSNTAPTSTLYTSWDILSTTSPPSEASRCYYDTHLRYYCVVPDTMADVSFSDMYSLIFSDTVLDALMTACPRGTWCLQNSPGEWDSLILEKAVEASRSLMAIDLCRSDMQSCILNMVNNFVGCSSYPRMKLTMEALQLVCGLREDTNLNITCYTHVISALHVTLADILRNNVNAENQTDTCQSPEAYMTKSLICVEIACPKESKRFHSFSPWTWFTAVQDDLMIECKLNPTICEVTVQSASPQQQEVTSQQKVTTTTTEEVTSTTPSWITSYYSTSTWKQESTPYPTEEDRCYTDAVFQNFCPVPEDMTDVSFWDLYSVLFSDTVLEALMVGCSKGSWCIKDRYDYWDSLIAERVDMVMNSEIAASMCNPTVQPCVSRVVNSFVNCSMYPQMVFTSEVLQLVCGLKRNAELTTSCFKHVLSALHVTLADILRGEEDQEKSYDTCTSPEANMTRGLICVENSCPRETETFHSFKPWAWFTSVVNDLIMECHYDSTKCKALLQPPPGYLYGSEMGTMVGISVATMITALTLTIVVFTCYKRHRRNAVVKEGYQRLLTEGDES